ncbi:hypothetical protein, partial [Comamonas testosteroni]
ADAERWNDEEEAADALHQTAAVQAPDIVARQFAKVVKPGDWFDKYTFAGGMSADELLYQAMEASDDATQAAFAELMVSPAAQPLREAIANHFAKLHAFAIYTDHQEDLQ